MNNEREYPLDWGGHGFELQNMNTTELFPKDLFDKAKDLVENVEVDLNKPLGEHKYEIIYDEMSCYDWGFIINDTWRSGEDSKHPEEDDELLDYLLLKLKEGIKRGTCSFKDLVECFQSEDTVFAKGSCDDCGHSGHKTTWKI